MTVLFGNNESETLAKNLVALMQSDISDRYHNSAENPYESMIACMLNTCGSIVEKHFAEEVRSQLSMLMGYATGSSVRFASNNNNDLCTALRAGMRGLWQEYLTFEDLVSSEEDPTNRAALIRTVSRLIMHAVTVGRLDDESEIPRRRRARQTEQARAKRSADAKSASILRDNEAAARRVFALHPDWDDPRIVAEVLGPLPAADPKADNGERRKKRDTSRKALSRALAPLLKLLRQEAAPAN